MNLFENLKYSETFRNLHKKQINKRRSDRLHILKVSTTAYTDVLCTQAFCTQTAPTHTQTQAEAEWNLRNVVTHISKPLNILNSSHNSCLLPL